MEDRNQSYVGIGIYSYEPKGSKGKNLIRILSYEIPMKFLQTKGGLSMKLSDSSPQVELFHRRQWIGDAEAEADNVSTYVAEPPEFPKGGAVYWRGLGV